MVGFSFDKHSSDESKAFTELKSSTGVKGVRDAKAVDNISRTCKQYLIWQRGKLNVILIIIIGLQR